MPSASPDRGAVLITGTSSGIGRTTALLLDRAGYRVFAGVRKEQDGQRLQAEASSALVPVILDVTRPEQISAAVALIQERLGAQETLRALINNAGIVEVGPLECISLERVRRQFEVNVFGHLAVTQAFLPLLRRGPGRIVTVISAVIDSPPPILGPYCASKCAAHALFLTLRRELRWFQIPVSLILPGFISGPIWDTAQTAIAQIEKEDSQGVYRPLVGLMFGGLEPSMKWAASPDVVAKTIHRALTARWPRATYRCGPGSQLSRLGNWLPESLVHAGLKWCVKRQKLPATLGSLLPANPTTEHKA